MPKCPKCKAKIDVLSYSEDIYGKFYLDDDKNPEYNPKGGEYEYNCPECFHFITGDEEEAIKFLKKK